MKPFRRILIGVTLNCAVLGLTMSVAGCGAKEDALRTVKSYEFASCDSTPTTDAIQLEAIGEFKRGVQSEYFVRHDGRLFAANHESAAEDSGLREYEGPFYIYVHPHSPTEQETAKGIDWSAMIYLHAKQVRTLRNGGTWSEWERVRTRNFAQAGRTVDGLGRWKCLMGSEIAWARVSRSGSQWTVVPQAVGVYEEDELSQALPVPSKSEVEGASPVAPLSGASDSAAH
jgi:hypothetical protein